MDNPKTLTILTGASRGMGLAMAQQLLVPGAWLLCISRQTNADLQAQAEHTGCSLEQWNADLGEPAPVARRLAQWLDALNPLSVHSAALINNAAVLPAIVPLRGADASDLSRAMRVNLEAPMLLTSAFLHSTRQWQSPRKVLNISSGLGRRPMASQSAYCAAKAGLDHFTRSLALDEAAQPNGARVCSLAPGVIDTGMQTQLRGADAEQFPDIGAFAALHASGQLASPEAAARKVLGYLHRKSFGDPPVGDVRDTA
jgi:NAD(P)-dependent dehydrogenase (short-subunit alcohol dehydrogenase family)